MKTGSIWLSENPIVRNIALEQVVTITHNLGKYPFILVIDSNDYMVESEIKYLNLNQFVIVFRLSRKLF